MGAMLMEQGFEKRLEECERNVLQKLELTKEDVEAATKRFKEDPEVQLRTVGMKDMYKDAILGILPLLPAAKMPPALSSAVRRSAIFALSLYLLFCVCRKLC